MPEVPADLAYELKERYGLVALQSQTNDDRFNFVLYGDEETVLRLHEMIVKYGPELAAVVSRGE